ncbi:MAG: hypothetical protein AAF902_07795 [Chloroflexota bacterium]
MQKKTEIFLLAILFLITLGLRVWQLDSVPPGWRDDELINSLVISQHTLDGDIRAYYSDASGHEGLYHILNAPFLAFFGPSPAGIRLLSVILGGVTIFFTYLLAVQLFGQKHRPAAFIIALGLSLSFWSLMYSRTGIRHIALPACVLPSFYFLWRWLAQVQTDADLPKLGRNLLWSAVFLALAYYTYFASRGVPLILVAFFAYLTLINWPIIKKTWQPLLIFFVLSTLFAFPLYLSIQAQPGADARVAELAVPLIAMGEGDFAPLFEYIRVTLGMFHATGDSEFLYNIPNRPVFGPLGAILFWLGIVICVWQTLTPLWRKWVNKAEQNFASHWPYAFLLLWWGAGISPAFISVPPASLSHTILAQSAVYIILGVPLIFLLDQFEIQPSPSSKSWDFALVNIIFGAALIIPIGFRDLPAYFVEWPGRGQTRFLYRADIRELAEEISSDQIVDFAVGGPLAGPWDRIALNANLGGHAAEAKVRWYNPERAAFLLPRVSIFGRPRTAQVWLKETFQPIGTGIGEFNAYRSSLLPFPDEDEVCFENNLCLTPNINYQGSDQPVEVVLQVFVTSIDQLPIVPLISNPSPPDVYAGSRLSAFVQLLAADGTYLTGDDGFWVDPETLEVGDIFQQRHTMLPPGLDAGDTIAFGLYDPMTGQRILTKDGRDSVHIQILE